MTKIALLSALALLACHDAPRKNPFDPVLTPAVILTEVRLDEQTGDAHLAWTTYAGKQPFAAYLVLRQEQGLVAVDTVVVADIGQTSYVDAGLRAEVDYIYRVAVANQQGFVVESEPASLRSFAVAGVELLAVEPDGLAGTVALRWQQYRGAQFRSYEVWRERVNGETERLASIEAQGDTLRVDATPVPGEDYLYWIELRAADEVRTSLKRGAVYQLPGVMLEQVEMSSETASAVLSWSAYPGPGFAGYAVLRKKPGLEEEVVAELLELTDAKYVDGGLDGNTVYDYRVMVRTQWGLAVHSNIMSGSFHALVETRLLPDLDNADPYAVALAFDENDGLYAALTTFSESATRSLGTVVLETRFQVVFPDGGVTTVAVPQAPDSRSPIFAAAGMQRVFVATGIEKVAWVTALEPTGEVIWQTEVELQGFFAAGLHADGEGEVVLADDRGWTYRLGPDGVANESLPLTFNTSPRPTALTRLIVAPFADAVERFLMLRPDHGDNRVFSRERNPSDGLFTVLSGYRAIDEGIGFGAGQLLDPVALAFDAARQRILVLENQGVLVKAFDARPDVEDRYITQWGRFGTGAGEFEVVSPVSAALAVDSQSFIYVADGSGRIQVFAP